MSEQLTPQQKMAVENRGGKLLVSAAAGSGKTKVLVDRLLSYLSDPVDPANLDEFLIITYTKAAASELRGKISERLTKYIAEHPDNKHMQQQIQRLHLAKISTVHGFCADILREYAYRLDITSDFRIAEENESQEMMYEVLQRLLDTAYSEKLEDAAFRAFVDTQGLGRDDRQVPEIILQIYASALCHMDPDGWLDWCLTSANVDGIQDASETVWGAYLIADLKKNLDLHIRSLERCISRAEIVPGLEKPVSLLRSTINQLKSLRLCDSWDSIVAHPSLEYGTLSFSKEHRGTELSEKIKAVRNACKEQITKKMRVFTDTSSSVLSHMHDSMLASRGLIELVKDFRVQFERLKRARHVLDFSDIEQLTLDLLLGKKRTGATNAANEIGGRFREIMIDEYQDSNEVQDAIFSELARKRQNCFMVGDVKQSIYRFRLADPDIFIQKYNVYQSPENVQPGEGRKVLLSSNFRSSAGIISAVNDVFTDCMSPEVGGLEYSEDEMLREGLPHVTLPESEVELYGVQIQEDTYQEEANFVAQRIATLLDGTHMVRQNDVLRPITPDDIVILLRSPGSVGAEFSYALEQQGIRCTMGADTDLLLTPEVETLCAILQIIHNPLQDIPLIAALSSPVFGFTADDLALIRSRNRRSKFYKALSEFDSQKTIWFCGLLNKLRYESRFCTISQLIHRIFIATGMLSIYRAMEDGDQKVQNLQSFCQIAANYEATGRKELLSFLEYLSAMEENGIRVAGVTASGVVRIMSIHKSKGLEFPVVFLCGLSRVFNTTDIKKQILCHKELGLGFTHTNMKQRISFPTIAKRAIASKILDETISEELRVLYVAMTRARDRLIMTYASSKLEDKLQDISLRLDMSEQVLLTANVSCPGHWVLLSALQRTEAGAFFHLAEKPDCSCVRDHPWLIDVVEAVPDTTAVSDPTPQLERSDTAYFTKMQQGLSFRYRYASATEIPSKMTATQLKGRVKDQEAAEYTTLPKNESLSFRKPDEVQAKRGTEYGTALHSVMQHVNLKCCGSDAEIVSDISRMVETGLISAEQAALVDPSKISLFFNTELGRRIANGREVLREFKFSILEDASKYYSDVENDRILLQGVVDCALVEDAGITVIDFKTDYITDFNFDEKVQAYSTQIKTYADALSRIFEKPVLESYIYFFHNGKFVCVK